MSKRISYKVTGVVQGVNFRAWTEDKARGLSMTGFVKNASDGTVVGEAQGSEDTIQRFVQHLHMGPRAANVSKVEQQEMAAKEDETTFSQIRR